MDKAFSLDLSANLSIALMGFFPIELIAVIESISQGNKCYSADWSVESAQRENQMDAANKLIYPS